MEGGKQKVEEKRNNKETKRRRYRGKKGKLWVRERG